MRKNTLILKAAGSLFFLKIFGYASSFLVFVFIARLVSVEQFGVFSYVFSWLSVLSVISTFGLDKYLLREVAKTSSRNEWTQLVSQIRDVMCISLGISFTVAIFAGLAIAFFTQGSSLELWLVTFTGMLSLPLMGLNLIRQESLVGLRKVVLGQLPNFILYPIFLFIFCSLIKFSFGFEFNAFILIFAHGISTLLTFLIGLLFLRFCLPTETPYKISQVKLKNYLSEGKFFFLIALSGIIFARASVLLLGIAGLEEDTAIFNVALRCTATITFILAAVNSASAPAMATLFRDGKLFDLQKLISKTTVFIFVYSSIISCTFWFFGDHILSLFGNEYRAGLSSLQILCVGQFVNGATGSVGYLLQMTHHEKIAAITTMIGAFTIVCLGGILIPSMGLTGAAIATTTARILTNIVNVLIAYRLTGVNTSIIPFHIAFKR